MRDKPIVTTVIRPTTTPTKAFIKSLPAPWQPCVEDGWILEDTESIKFQLLEEAEFLEQHKQKYIINTFINNAASMEKALQQNGHANTPMNRYLHLFPNLLIEKLVKYTNQQLAKDEGIMKIFEDAGASILPNSCGICAGYGSERLGEDVVCISSTARNFQGRMGALSSGVYLGSPYTVAASAIAGEISDPRNFIETKND